jgi:hypothetical protein
MSMLLLILANNVGYDSAWSSLLWLRDDYKFEPEPRWITQLSHWQTALDAQDRADRAEPITTFSSLNTRMICRTSRIVQAVLTRQTTRSVSLNEATNLRNSTLTD